MQKGQIHNLCFIESYSVFKPIIGGIHESLETTRRYCQPSYHDLEKAVQFIGEEED